MAAFITGTYNLAFVCDSTPMTECINKCWSTIHMTFSGQTLIAVPTPQIDVPANCDCPGEILNKIDSNTYFLGGVNMGSRTLTETVSIIGNDLVWTTVVQPKLFPIILGAKSTCRGILDPVGGHPLPPKTPSTTLSTTLSTTRLPAPEPSSTDLKNIKDPILEPSAIPSLLDPSPTQSPPNLNFNNPILPDSVKVEATSSSNAYGLTLGLGIGGGIILICILSILYFLQKRRKNINVNDRTIINFGFKPLLKSSSTPPLNQSSNCEPTLTASSIYGFSETSSILNLKTTSILSKVWICCEDFRADEQVNGIGLNYGELVVIESLLAVEGWGRGLNTQTGCRGVFPLRCLTEKDNFCL